jgi:hypothetical protein
MSNKKTIKRSKKTRNKKNKRIRITRNKKGGVFDFFKKKDITCTPNDMVNLNSYSAITQKINTCCKKKTLFGSKKIENPECVTLDAKKENYDKNQRKLADYNLVENRNDEFYNSKKLKEMDDIYELEKKVKEIEVQIDNDNDEKEDWKANPNAGFSWEHPDTEDVYYGDEGRKKSDEYEKQQQDEYDKEQNDLLNESRRSLEKEKEEDMSQEMPSEIKTRGGKRRRTKKYFNKRSIRKSKRRKH